MIRYAVSIQQSLNKDKDSKQAIQDARVVFRYLPVLLSNGM